MTHLPDTARMANGLERITARRTSETQEPMLLRKHGRYIIPRPSSLHSSSSPPPPPIPSSCLVILLLALGVSPHHKSFPDFKTLPRSNEDPKRKRKRNPSKKTRHKCYDCLLSFRSFRLRLFLTGFIEKKTRWTYRPT